jgi:hypothetical protein
VSFPPPAPVTLTQILPSYVYQQYSDDDDVMAFVAAYNALAQQYMDWFVQTPLAVYTGPAIISTLLDWVAQGLYGIMRPTLSSGRTKNQGPFNTYHFNDRLDFNQRTLVGPQNYTVTTDDVFKRIITWHFYKGDGKVFNIRWLKRRIMRFLTGVNGTAGAFDSTYQVSVTFGASSQVNIVIRPGSRFVTGGAIVGGMLVGATVVGSMTTRFVAGQSTALASILVEALNSGALELPFTVSNFTVTIF